MKCEWGWEKYYSGGEGTRKESRETSIDMLERWRWIDKRWNEQGTWRVEEMIGLNPDMTFPFLLFHSIRSPMINFSSCSPSSTSSPSLLSIIFWRVFIFVPMMIHVQVKDEICHCRRRRRLSSSYSCYLFSFLSALVLCFRALSSSVPSFNISH